MHSIFSVLFILLCVSYVCAQGPITATVNTVKKNNMKKIDPSAPGISIRQSSGNKPADACPQFVTTYAKVRMATYFMIRKLKPFNNQYAKCQACLLCRNCDTPLNNGIVKSVNQCLKQHTYGACLVAINVIGVGEKVHFGCTLFLTTSRVGNCFVEEYLALNGYRGQKNALVFYREVGIVNGLAGQRGFQCRAGRRAKVGKLKNQHICRSKFRVSPRQMTAVFRCASTDSAKASADYSSCLLGASSSFAYRRCFISYLFKAKIAYLKCSIPHGDAAVIATSLAAGVNPYDCPVLRRDSWIGRCRAPDFIRLIRLKLVNVKSNYLQVLLPGACKY